MIYGHVGATCIALYPVVLFALVWINVELVYLLFQIRKMLRHYENLS